ncbi:DUF308 domain-containing protein [Erysipelotrichaceae bacterium HCN-30851]
MNFKIENWKLFVLSIFYIIFSILSYVIEKEKFLNFFQIAGIIIILIGFFQVLIYFFKKDYQKPDDYSFSFGVLYCMAGLIVATKPNLIVDNYPNVISGVVVLDATLRLQFSMNLFRLQDRQWKIHLGLAVVPILLGMSIILIKMQPHTLQNLFSFLLLLDAAANFYTILYYRHVMKRYNRKNIQLDEEGYEIIEK